MSGGHVPIREPQQERSRESYERVMEAGLAVLVEDGWHDFTLTRVCEKAGVSVGMLYSRFRGRDELLAALQDRWLAQAELGITKLNDAAIPWNDLTPVAAVREAVTVFVALMREMAEATRVIGVHESSDRAGRGRLSRISHEHATWFREGLHHHASAIAHADPDRAIDFSFRIMFDLIVRRITHGDDFATGSEVGDWDAFSTEIWSACCAYLFRPELP